MEKLSQERIGNPAIPSLQKFQEEGGIGFFQQILPRLVGLTFVIGVLAFFFIMIIGAIQWISSGGDKTAIEGARGKIANALVGIVILLSLVVLLNFVGDFFGINILKIDLGPLRIGSE